MCVGGLKIRLREDVLEVVSFKDSGKDLIYEMRKPGALKTTFEAFFFGDVDGLVVRASGCC